MKKTRLVPRGGRRGVTFGTRFQPRWTVPIPKVVGVGNRRRACPCGESAPSECHPRRAFRIGLDVITSTLENVMNRREVLAGLGAGAAVLAGVGPAVADDKTKDTKECCTECSMTCSKCLAECLKCYSHCAEMVAQGKKEYVECMKACLDCSEFCKQCLTICGRGGPMMAICCEACAKACEMCAKACEKHPEDKTCVACAKMCRECVKCCNSCCKK